MYNATIKNLVSDKGFGFLTVEGRPKDLFFHVSAFKGDFKDLVEGQAVSFEDIVNNGKGDSAIGVELV